MSESEGGSRCTDADQKLVNFFRQHINLFVGIDTSNIEWLIDIALEDESGVTELLKLIKRDERQLITDFLLRIKSEGTQTFQLFKQAVERGTIVKQNGRSISTLFLINGDIDNLKLFLSILPLEIGNITDMYRYPMISIVFLVNLYPHIIPEQMFIFRHSFRYKMMLRKIVENLVSVGIIEIKSSIIDFEYDAKSKKYFKEIVNQSEPSLFEIVLRQCRRDRVDLSALPLPLNCVNLDTGGTDIVTSDSDVDSEDYYPSDI